MAQDSFFRDSIIVPGNFINPEKFLNRNNFKDWEIPALNVRELEKNYEIELAVPGYNEEDFDLTIDNGILSISAKKEEEKEEKNDEYLRKGFSYNSFSRSFNLRELDGEKEYKRQV